MTSQTPPDGGVDVPWPDDPDQRHDAGEPEDAFPVPFRMLDGLLLVVWTVVAQFLVGIPAVTLLGLDLDQPAVVLLLTATIQVATFAGIIAWLRARGSLSWRTLGPVRPHLKHVGMGIGFGIIAFLLVFVSAEMFDNAFGPFEEPDQALLGYDYSDSSLVVLLVLVGVVLAPLVEETVFRSILFQSTRRTLGMFPGLVLSSVAFTLVHVEVLSSPPGVLGLLLLGAWLAAVMHTTGSLVTAVTTHATYNLVVVALTVLAAGADSGVTV